MMVLLFLPLFEAPTPTQVSLSYTVVYYLVLFTIFLIAVFWDEIGDLIHHVIESLGKPAKANKELRRYKKALWAVARNEEDMKFYLAMERITLDMKALLSKEHLEKIEYGRLDAYLFALRQRIENVNFDLEANERFVKEWGEYLLKRYGINVEREEIKWYS